MNGVTATRFFPEFYEADRTMRDKVTATWIIAALMLGGMAFFSLLPSLGYGGGDSSIQTRNEYVIHHDDMADELDQSYTEGH